MYHFNKIFKFNMISILIYLKIQVEFIDSIPLDIDGAVN